MDAVITPPQQKNASTVVDSWNNLIFVLHEPDRHGCLVWNVRLALGDLQPWKFGPFNSMKAARAAMNHLGELLEDAIGDLPSDLGFHTHCSASPEW